MFSRMKPSGLRKQARRSRSRSLSRRDNICLPVLSTNDDDDDSKLLVSSTVLSTVSTKSGSSHNSGQEVIPDWTLTSNTIPLKKKRSVKDLLLTRSRSLTRSLSSTKNNVYEYDKTKPTERRSRSWSRSFSLSRSLMKKDKELAISNEHEGALIFEVEEAPKTLSQSIPLKKKESLKDRLATSAPLEPSATPMVKAEPKAVSQGDNKEADVYEHDNTKPMNERSRLWLRSLSLSRSLKKKDNELAISDEHEGALILKVEEAPKTLSQSIPLKKEESLKNRLATFAPLEPSVTPMVKAEPKAMPLKKTRSVKERRLARPPSFTKELDFSMTAVEAPKSPPRSYGQPRITINDGSQQIIDPPPPPSQESPSSDDDESCRYAVPESYSLRRSPVTRGRSGKPESERVVEERHWGSKSAHPRSRSHLSDARSESTWIPTNEDRYKLASVFIFGEEEADNASVESTSAHTGRTELTGTTEGDTSIFSESTGVNPSIFTGFTDYSEATGATSKTSATGYTGATSKTSVTEHTGVTSKTSATGYTGATSKTSATGYTTDSGDTSESSDTVSSFSDDNSFPSTSTKSQITTMTKETSLFDLDLDDGDTPIKKRARNPKRNKKPKKKKNVFLEIMLDLLSMAEEMADERDGCRRGLPCMGYRS